MKGEASMKYRETYTDTASYKRDYLSGLEALIAKRQRDAEDQRNAYVKDIFLDPERYRGELRRMLGYPLSDEREREVPTVTMEKLSDEDFYSVYRMRYEVTDGLIMTGLFFRIAGEEKRPLVIVQHGGEGTPEAISGVYGFTSNYNDMLMRVIRNDVHAFCPQLLLWKTEKYGVPYDRNDIDERLKSAGSSIAAVELYGIMRALDYFESLSEIEGFGMVGLSYGGFYTQFMTALDVRIRAAISCAYFNKREVCHYPDWTWFASLRKFDDAELACLVYPRKLYLEVGKSDPLFGYESAEAAFERLRMLCADIGTEWVEFIPFDGVHEFCPDDEPIKKMIEDIKKV
jgi:hypothetical protein